MDLTRRADAMRLITLRLGVHELRQITQQATVSEAVRVTIHYHDGRAPESVATLQRGNGDKCSLQVIYDRSPKPAILTYELLIERYHTLLTALRQARFDLLDDEEDLPFTGADLWWIERAAGSFYHDLVVSPLSARGHHRELILALREHLQEAVRIGA